MKGKKFDACEKHFKEKEIKLNREIKSLRNESIEVIYQNDQLSHENEQLKKENLELKAKYEKLLEYSKLNDEDIKEATQKDKSMNNAATMLNMMMPYALVDHIRR